MTSCRTDPMSLCCSVRGTLLGSGRSSCCVRFESMLRVNEMKRGQLLRWISSPFDELKVRLHPRQAKVMRIQWASKRCSRRYVVRVTVMVVHWHVPNWKVERTLKGLEGSYRSYRSAYVYSTCVAIVDIILLLPLTFPCV
jgi:hypothetical protein